MIKVLFFVLGTTSRERGGGGGRRGEQPQTRSQCTDGGHERLTDQHTTRQPTCGEPRGRKGRGGMGLISRVDPKGVGFRFTMNCIYRQIHIFI